MTLYLEDVFLVNFIPDMLLLWLALRCQRAMVRPLRLIAAAFVGAAGAVVYPLFSLPAAADYAVRLLGAFLPAAVVLPSWRLRAWVCTGCIFLVWMFLMGGAMTALFSAPFLTFSEGAFAGERVHPVLVCAGAACFAAGAVLFLKCLRRAVHARRYACSCTLVSGERSCRLRGLWDSGNALTFRGVPVCVISPLAAFALFGEHPKSVGMLRIGSVNGERTAPVFVCARLQAGEALFEDVYLTTGTLGGRFGIVLHPSLREVSHGLDCNTRGTVEQDDRGRERRALPVRGRGASAAPLARGRGGDAPKTRTGRGGGGDQKSADRT